MSESEKQLIARAMAALGKKKSAAKSAAARANGTAGGRPEVPANAKPCTRCGRRLAAQFQIGNTCHNTAACKRRAANRKSQPKDK